MAFPDGWAVRCPIDIAQTTAALTDWPCILNENGLPADIFDKALEGGGDIRFSSDQDGTTQLPCHVRHFAKAGTANIAVKTSTSDSAATRIYVWYLKAAETQPPVGDPYGQYATYDANYLAVLPFTEDPAGGGVAVDATGNGNDVTAGAGAANPVQAAGQIYRSWEFDGADDFGSMADLALTRPASVEAVIYENSSISVCLLGGDGEPGNQWVYLIQNNNAHRWRTDSATASKTAGTMASPAWNHVGFRWAVSVFNPVVNGVNGGGTGNLAGTSTVRRIGLDTEGALPAGDVFRVEELRIANNQRTVEWMQAGYENIMNPGTFLTVGTPENVIGGLTTTVTATNAAGSDVEAFNWVEVSPP